MLLALGWVLAASVVVLFVIFLRRVHQTYVKQQRVIAKRNEDYAVALHARKLRRQRVIAEKNEADDIALRAKMEHANRKLRQEENAAYRDAHSVYFFDPH